MHKLLVTFLVAFVGISILSAVMAGGGGIVSTVLTEDIGEDDRFIPMESTALFADQDIIRIGSEKILYSSTNSTGATVYTRGYEGTTAQAHKTGARIYTTEASIFNDALNFNMGVVVETGGVWGLITLPILFFTNTLPHLIVLNANWLRSPELAFIGIFWFAFGVALLITLAIQIAPIAISLVSSAVGLIRR